MQIGPYMGVDSKKLEYAPGTIYVSYSNFLASAVNLQAKAGLYV